MNQIFGLSAENYPQVMIVDMHDSYNMTRYLYDMSKLKLSSSDLTLHSSNYGRWRVCTQVYVHRILRGLSTWISAALL